MASLGTKGYVPRHQADAMLPQVTVPAVPTRQFQFWDYLLAVYQQPVKSVIWIPDTAVRTPPRPATRQDWDYWKMTLDSQLPYSDSLPKIKSPFAESGVVNPNVKQLEASSIVTTPTYEASPNAMRR